MGTLTGHIDAYVCERRRAGRFATTTVPVVRSRLRSLDVFFGDRSIDRLTPRMIEAWLGALDGKTASTRHGHLSAARPFCRWMVVDGRIAKDPTLEVEPVKRPRSVPRAQPVRVITAIFAACVTERERLIVRLMVGMGLRACEVSRARWEHWDERAGLLTVRGKGDHERVVPVPREVSRALTHASNRSATGPIVASQTTGDHVTARCVSTLMTAVIRRAGVKRHAYDGISGHALRHTCLSDVMDRCLDLRVVMEIAGHQNLSSAAIYQRRADLPAMRDAMEGRDYNRGDVA